MPASARPTPRRVFSGFAAALVSVLALSFAATAVAGDGAACDKDCLATTDLMTAPGGDTYPTKEPTKEPAPTCVPKKAEDGAEDTKVSAYDAQKSAYPTTEPEPTKDPYPTKDPDPSCPPTPVTPPTSPVTPMMTEPTLVVSPPPASMEQPKDPNMLLRKVGPKRVLAGRSATWRIRIVNRGPGIARNVVLRDQIPPGFALTRSRIRITSGDRSVVRRLSYRIRGNRIIWKLGTLKPGARRTIFVTMRSMANTRGRRVNQAHMSAENHKNLSAKAPINVRRAPSKKSRPRVTG